MEWYRGNLDGQSRFDTCGSFPSNTTDILPIKYDTVV